MTGEELIEICALCGRVLDLYKDVNADASLNEERWDHTRGDKGRVDHAALMVRVPTSQANLRCDFCHDDVSAYSAHRLITHDVVIDGGGEEAHMGEIWLADQPCAELIMADRWSDLFDRGVEGYERRHVQPISVPAKVMLRVLYTAVRENVIRLDAPLPLPREGG